MGLIGGLIGGVVAGLVGALAWGGIAYGTGYEIRWIAVLIGGVVGLGVALGDQGRSGPLAGGLAAAIAICSILGGKFLAVNWILDKGPDDRERTQMINEAMADRELIISYVADEVVEDFLEEGRAMHWPPGAEPGGGTSRADYPADVWEEAENRYRIMDSNDRNDLVQLVHDDLSAQIDAMIVILRDELASEGFMASFGLIDILFFGLAVVGAYKIAETGSIGGSSD